MNLDTLNSGELLQEIMELARVQGVTSQEMWNNLCNEVLESHEQLGELGDEENTSILRQTLYMGWMEYELLAGEESLDSIDEDPRSPRG
ncbi:hypothetical protein IT408_03330 [Candidatus Uhrbacteria bacterium]|nr:hypothetical protein [Candidatus Uhrbacteria bacterium]